MRRVGRLKHGSPAPEPRPNPPTPLRVVGLKAPLRRERVCLRASSSDRWPSHHLRRERALSRYRRANPVGTSLDGLSRTQPALQQPCSAGGPESRNLQAERLAQCRPAADAGRRTSSALGMVDICSSRFNDGIGY